jgi:hypothetical protein
MAGGQRSGFSGQERQKDLHAVSIPRKVCRVNSRGEKHACLTSELDGVFSIHCSCKFMSSAGPEGIMKCPGCGSNLWDGTKCAACGRLGSDLSPRVGTPSNDVYIPRGGTAQLLGLLIAGLGLAALLGLVPSLDLSIKLVGVALAVAGYLACVVVPQLNRRINDVERRLALRLDIQERRLLAIEKDQRDVGAGPNQSLQGSAAPDSGVEA